MAHLIAVGLCALVVVSWLVGSIGVRIARVTPNPKARLEPPARSLSLEARDGSRIAATFWPGRAADGPAILIVPGIGALHRRYMPNAAWFNALGYAVLAIDLRGHGASGPALHTYGWTESRDVHAAFAWLKAQQQGAKVAIIGISMGGSAMLVGPDGPVAADAYVIQAVFPDLRQAVRCRIAFVFGPWLGWLLEPLLSFQSLPRFGQMPSKVAPLAIVPRLEAPVLVVGGARDRFVPPDVAEAFHAAAKDPRGLWIAPDLGHNAISDTLSEAYRQRVLAFLKDTIGS